MHQVALVDRLQQQLVLLAPALRARSRRPPARPPRWARPSPSPSSASSPLSSPASSPPRSASSARRRAREPAGSRRRPTLTGAPARAGRRTPPRRPSACARSAPRCGPARGTRPRTGTGADTPRARAAPGTSSRRPPGRSPWRPRSRCTGRSLKNTLSRPVTLCTWTGTEASSAAARRPVGQPRGERREAHVGELVEQLERGDPRRHRQRVARQRARLVDLAGRGQHPHQLAAAPDRGGRQPAADHLAHDRQVGRAPRSAPGRRRRPPGSR